MLLVKEKSKCTETFLSPIITYPQHKQVRVRLYQKRRPLVVADTLPSAGEKAAWGVLQRGSKFSVTSLEVYRNHFPLA